MKYIIDTETMQITPYEEKTTTTTPGTRGLQMVTQLEAWKGAHEWDGIVSGIQKWFYGYVLTASWCATTMSYLLTAVGIPVKRDNVKFLYDFGEQSGVGRFYTRNELPKTIKRGDILFFLWEGDTMDATSKKHVTMCERDTDGERILCIGGNQSDGINATYYNRKYLYGVWRID